MFEFICHSTVRFDNNYRTKLNVKLCVLLVTVLDGLLIYYKYKWMCTIVIIFIYLAVLIVATRINLSVPTWTSVTRPNSHHFRWTCSWCKYAFVKHRQTCCFNMEMECDRLARLRFWSAISSNRAIM